MLPVIGRKRYKTKEEKKAEAAARQKWYHERKLRQIEETGENYRTSYSEYRPNQMEIIVAFFGVTDKMGLTRSQSPVLDKEKLDNIKKYLNKE